GHYAGYPIPVVEGGRELVAHQIGDTMTDPSVRHIGRGPTSILGQTALHFYTNFCEGKIAFNYGFNVANIQRFSLRFLRSDRIEPVSYWFRDDPIARTGRLHRWRRGYRLEHVRETTSEYDSFFEDVAPAYRFLVRRDSRYLRWRYLECPDAGAVMVAIRKWECLPRSRRSIVVGRCAVRSGARRCGRDFDSSRGAELSCGSRRSLVFAAAAVACRRSYRNRFCGRSRASGFVADVRSFRDG